MDDVQIVIYSKKEINSKEQLKISGKVIKVLWKSEKTGDLLNIILLRIIMKFLNKF